MSPLSKASNANALRRGVAEHPAPPEPAPVIPETTGPKPERWPARISMKASPEMKRWLELARIDDGVEVTARLRAMIMLWHDDPKLRARVDELARTLR
jgi:hypothetical protein